MIRIYGIIQFLIIGVVTALVVGPAVCRAGDKEWITTNKWSGQGSLTTETYNILGKKWRLRYNPEGAPPFHVYVNNKHGETISEAGIPRPVLRGSRIFQNDKGKRYLYIHAPRARWTIKVQQHLSIIQQWNHREWVESRPTPSIPVASMAGKTTKQSFRVIKTAKTPWKAVCRNLGKGQVQVRIEKASAEKDKKKQKSAEKKPYPVLNTTISGRGEQTGWIYSKGAYLVRVHAKDTKWKLTVYRTGEHNGDAEKSGTWGGSRNIGEQVENSGEPDIKARHLGLPQRASQEKSQADK